MLRPSGHSLWGNYDDGSLPENKKEGDVRYFYLSGKLSMREKFGVGGCQIMTKIQ